MEVNYKILPRDYCRQPVETEVLHRAAVIVHLYYDDLFEQSMSYLRNIPGEIDTYIVTANPKLEAMAKQVIQDEHLTNFSVITKPNRGRDYAALFVTASDIIPRYSYICFVHDKKSHRGDAMELGSLWRKCLFESTLAGSAYIRNVIATFEMNPGVGFLSAPVSPEEYLLCVDGALWTINYPQTAAFLRKIGIRNIPAESDNPLYVGSAFWFRADAMQKLLDVPFTYEDFPAEPMSLDGTIAHAIERSFGYVAQDAGYSSAYVVPDDYAEYILTRKTTQLTQAMQVLRAADLVACSDNKVDFDRSLSLCDAQIQGNELIDYCVHYQRVFLFTQPGSEQIVASCRQQLAAGAVTVGDVFTTIEIDEAIVQKPNNGFVICATGQSAEYYLRFLESFGRSGFVFFG